MSRSVAAVLFVMLAAGWPCRCIPFRGDESLFLVMAGQLARGAVLYRDVWDVTNPGTIWFYQLAGTLFGFTEEGVRLLEWAYYTAFVCVVCEASRRANGLARWPLSPAVFVGLTYFFTGYARTSHLAKTEGLVGFPFFVAFWLAARACDPAKRAAPRLIVAGIAGGVVVVFKLLFAAVLAPVWLTLGVFYLRRRGMSVWNAFGFVGGLLIGMLLVLGPAVVYFAANDALGPLWWTLIELPPQFMAEGPRATLGRLTSSARWFFESYSAVMAAAVVSGAAVWRTRRDPFVPAAVVWFAAAGVVLLAQRLSWWSYHFPAVGTPAAVLAGYGWPAYAAAVRDWRGGPLPRLNRIALAAAGMFVLSPVLAAGGYGYLELALHGFGLTAADRARCREDIGGAYSVARPAADWLASAPRPGPVLVIGDPIIHVFTGRPLGTRINAWSLEMYPTAVRDEFEANVRRARPVYVYWSRRLYGEDLLRDKYPWLLPLLADGYERMFESADGAWYERR